MEKKLCSYCHGSMPPSRQNSKQQYCARSRCLEMRRLNMDWADVAVRNRFLLAPVRHAG